MRRTTCRTATIGRSQRPTTKVNSSGDDIALLPLGHDHDLEITFVLVPAGAVFRRHLGIGLDLECLVRPMAPASLVQISDRLSFGPQRTNVLPCDDVTSQAVNFVTLGRCPTAKILHAFQQAEPEDLSIFT